MRLNPVYKKEALISARSYTLPFSITAVNAALTLLVLISLYAISSNAEDTGEIAYTSFLRVYYFIAGIEFLMILLLSPALTASSVTSERERKTLGILLTTQLTPADIILGKLMSAMSTMAVIILSSAPVLATIFIYGGVTVWQILLLLLIYFVTAIYTASIGILSSTLARSSAIATAAAYAAIFVSFGLMGALLYFRDSMGLETGKLISGMLITMAFFSVLMIMLSERGIHLERHSRRKRKQ